MSKHENPKAKDKNLILQKMGDETIVYDTARDEAICLNKTATSVWERCDGETSAHEIATALDDIGVEDVQLTLERLSRSKLLEAAYRAPSETFQTTSRRDVLRKLATASAFGAPLIASITAPTAAQAASCIPPGDLLNFCTNPSQCCDDCDINLNLIVDCVAGLCICVDL
ncbi:PqqD family protein [Hoeflea sp. CAU 1731]